MNLYMTKLRIQLDHWHLNDVARLRNQRNRILQPFAPVWPELLWQWKALRH